MKEFLKKNWVGFVTGIVLTVTVVLGFSFYKETSRIDAIQSAVNNQGTFLQYNLSVGILKNPPKQ